MDDIAQAPDSYHILPSARQEIVVPREDNLLKTELPQSIRSVVDLGRKLVKLRLDVTQSPRDWSIILLFSKRRSLTSNSVGLEY